MAIRPMIITENGTGVPGDDELVDGQVRDAQRTEYLVRHVAALGEAIRQGADVQGYFHWSSHDNFEWISGYGRRFGLIYVDFATQRRMLKQSAGVVSRDHRRRGHRRAIGADAAPTAVIPEAEAPAPEAGAKLSGTSINEFERICALLPDPGSKRCSRKRSHRFVRDDRWKDALIIEVAVARSRCWPRRARARFQRFVLCHPGTCCRDRAKQAPEQAVGWHPGDKPPG